MRTYSTSNMHRLAVSGCLLVALSFASWLSSGTGAVLSQHAIAPVVAPAPHPVPLAVIGQASLVDPRQVSPGTQAEVMPAPHPVPWAPEERAQAASVRSAR